MRTSLQRLERENSHWIGHYFAVLTVVASLTAIIKCLSRDGGIQLFLSFLTSFNIIDVFLIIALVFYGRYLVAMHKRKTFLTRGTRYDAVIIDTIPVTRGVVQYLQFKIQYDGDHTYITPKYMEDPKYKLVSEKCSIYVYKNRCYADDRFVTYIIDIPIQAKKPQGIPSTFDFAIRKYVMNTFSSYSSADIEQMTSQLRNYIIEIFADYFPHATLMDVKIRRIQ